MYRRERACFNALQTNTNHLGAATVPLQYWVRERDFSCSPFRKPSASRQIAPKERARKGEEGIDV